MLIHFVRELTEHGLNGAINLTSLASLIPVTYCEYLLSWSEIVTRNYFFDASIFWF